MTDTTARLIVALEAIEDGDCDLAADVLRDLLADLKPTRPAGRCRFCGLHGWPGEIQRHESVVHPHQLLETERKAA